MNASLLFHRRHNYKTNSVSIWPNVKVAQLKLTKLTQRLSCHHIETSQLICRVNELTGFYTMATLAFNESTLHPLLLHVFPKKVKSYSRK